MLPSNFDTSLFAPLLDAIHSHAGRATAFGTPEGVSARRIADHVRAAVFCIADGVRPSNVKQGYVVRKILRRAMLDRHLLGGDLRSPWLHTLADVVARSMGEAWPEVREARSLAWSTIAAEEEKFAGAFLSGSQRLAVLADEAARAGARALPGSAAFLLYDTFGLPLDLQRLLLAERRLDVDEAGFRNELAEQRRRSRESSRISDKIFDEGPLAAVAGTLPETRFLRERLELDGAQVLAVVDEGEAQGEAEGAGEARRVLLVLDRTPFYAEGGGQVGDAGEIEGRGWRVAVDDTVSLRGITLHRGTVVAGEPAPGRATARVDGSLRAATARNHTATHLLHAALRHVLGDEVTQAGSLVAPERLRFDFRFPRALTPAELEAVEDLVNAWILANHEVGCREMPREEARAAGAIALFGEKYGEVVRVVRVPAAGAGPESIELCGGTHVLRSGDIGLLRIVAEASVAAGIRRIEARTGLGALGALREHDRLLRQSAALLKAAPEQLAERVAALQEELRSVRRDLEELRSRMAGERLATAVRPWNGLQVLVAAVEGIPVKTLRELAGDWLRKVDLVLLAAPEGEATSFLAAAGPAAQ
ncbi:MAG TPA: alanine--tRNA ligase-related protein, partial [Planctomycetota bacterium]|nr:alanine--tRNA ligase-related protein [Planctomycetota bacterium]